MNKEIKNADIEKITVDYATKVRETEEEFIFQTITPFCCNILLKIISKKGIKRYTFKRTANEMDSMQRATTGRAERKSGV